MLKFIKLDFIKRENRALGSKRSGEGPPQRAATPEVADL
jgi:hypothetical protein